MSLLTQHEYLTHKLDKLIEHFKTEYKAYKDNLMSGDVMVLDVSGYSLYVGYCDLVLGIDVNEINNNDIFYVDSVGFKTKYTPLEIDIKYIENLIELLKVTSTHALTDVLREYSKMEW